MVHYVIVLDGEDGTGGPLCHCIRWGGRGLVVHYVIVLDGGQGTGGPLCHCIRWGGGDWWSTVSLY